MQFSYKWIKEYVSSLPKPDKLALILTGKAFEVEKIEKKDDDYILDIDILPNRASDAWSYWGLSREIASLLNKKAKLPQIKFKESRENIEKFLEIEIQNKKDVNVYYFRMVRGVKIKPSPLWLKNKLKTAGIKPINNIVDITNLVMLETGQPVHVFDYDKLNGEEKKKITVRNALQNEKFVSLDNKKYILSSEMLVSSDGKDALDLAGIKGGIKAEVNEKTKNIVIKAGNFSYSAILKTSKKLNLTTDASRRFSSKISPYFARVGLDLAVSLAAKLAGGKILKGILSFENLEKKFPIYLPVADIEKLLGEKISEKTIIQILKRIYCGIKIIKRGGEKILEIIPPPYRDDLTIKEDIIEEIARIYGYDKIKPRHLTGEIRPSRPEDNLLYKDTIKESLARTGFNEVYLYSFIGEQDLGFLNKEVARKIIGVQNFIRPEFRYLRPNLTLSLLKALAEARKYTSSAYLFELAPVFSMAGKFKDASALQKEHLALGICLENKSAQAFFEIKGRLTSIFDLMGVGRVEYIDKFNIGYELINDLNLVFHPFRSGLIQINNQIIGIIGEPKDEIKKVYSLKGEVAIVEMEFGKLLNAIEKEKEYRPISKYPALYRDIAILAPRSTKVIEILDIIENTAGKTLVDTDLFDIYEDVGVPDGKKSLAFHLIFQSEKKTLSDKEVDKIMDKIIKAIEANDELEVRK